METTSTAVELKAIRATAKREFDRIMRLDGVDPTGRSSGYFADCHPSFAAESALAYAAKKHGLFPDIAGTCDQSRPHSGGSVQWINTGDLYDRTVYCTVAPVTRAVRFGIGAVANFAEHPATARKYGLA